MESNNDLFPDCYMILKPEKVGFIDLMFLLFSSDMKDRTCVQCSAATLESFRYRFIIFLCIVIQKSLQLVAKPLENVGSGIEKGLNLLSITNGNLFKMILKYILGETPDKNSPTFSSFVGNLDKRNKLDDNIKPGDLKYNAALSMMASKLSYENKEHIKDTVTQHWEKEFLGFNDYWNDYQDKATTQVFMMRDKGEDHDTIFVAFRGTEPFDTDAWCSDLDISWYEIKNFGKIHSGFMKALGLQKNGYWPKELDQNKVVNPGTRPKLFAYYDIRDKLRSLLNQNDKAKYVITGHSLGGALAILFPAVLAYHEEKWLLRRLEGVYTFGQPRVGDETFGEFMKRKMVEHHIRYFRFVYGNNLVPRLPFDSLMFKHFGTCIYSNRHYQLKIAEDEPTKNYFSPLNAIPMMVNAFGELVRSFTLPIRKGSEYKEGSLLRVSRIFGLIIPGVSAHGPQDYANSTRLGSAYVFLPPKD